MPGSWTKRGKDSYRLQVSMGTDFKGDPIRYTKTVHCKSDAQAGKELAKFYAECESGNISKGNKITISAFCDKWMKEYAKNKVKKSSYTGYETTIRVHIKPLLGHHNLAKLKPLQVQEWINYLIGDRRLAPKTVHNYFSVLDTIMQTALKWGYISKNPCELMDLPSKEKKEAAYYNRDEVIALLDALEMVPCGELKYRVGITLTLFTGLRKGELMGLKWDNIDLDERMVSVVQTRMYNKGFGVYEDTPKTAKSRRRISIPKECVTLLRQLKLKEDKQRILIGSKWIESGAVFQNDYGEPLYPQMVSIWFRKFLKENGLQPLTMHQLRHTHTSMLAYLDMDKIQISQRLGHSQLSTTMNIYTHLFEETDRVISDRMSEEFFKTGTESPSKK